MTPGAASSSPQHAVQPSVRDLLGSSGRDTFITTEVGQHQMWAAQHFRFEKPNRWMTSGGLGTMGYGLPAAMGVQIAHPDALVIDIAGEASILMNIQEIGHACAISPAGEGFHPEQRIHGHGAPVAGIAAWLALFRKLQRSTAGFREAAESFHATGLRARKRWTSSTTSSASMLAIPGPVIADIAVDQKENCFPMIPSGAAHNEMIMGPEHANRGRRASPTKA